MSEKQCADYGTWKSPLSATLIFQGRQTASYPIPWQEGVLFLLTMPEEENALALMYCDLAGEVIRVSPPGFYLRSRVHEYGGLPFACRVTIYGQPDPGDSETGRDGHTGTGSVPRTRHKQCDVLISGEPSTAAWMRR